jgi:hypothetical protein
MCQVLYPAIRIKLGSDVAEHCLAEHQELKQRLAALTAASISDPNFDGMVQEYMQVRGFLGALQCCY